MTHPYTFFVVLNYLVTEQSIVSDWYRSTGQPVVKI